MDNEPKEGQIVASFAFTYWYKSKNPVIATRFVNKQILIDGNLMVKFGIVSRSAEEHIQTTAIYKYYYCPTEDKRIHVHVKNEVLKYPLPASGQKDVTHGKWGHMALSRLVVIPQVQVLMAYMI